jgi:hypothetical protein
MNLWRAFVEHVMCPKIYEVLTRECQDERQHLESVSNQLELEQDSCIENLDAALQIISEIAERFAKCTREQQRDILLQMVERVVIDAEGRVTRLEWKPPFCYLSVLQETDGKGIKS